MATSLPQPVNPADSQLALLKGWAMAYGIGLPIVGILVGVVLTQAVSYRKHFGKDDRRAISVSVAAVTFLTFFSFFVDLVGLEIKLALTYGSGKLEDTPAALYNNTTAWLINNMVSPISCLNQAICQIFFAKAAHSVSSAEARPFVKFGIGAGIALTLIGGVVRGIAGIVQGPMMIPAPWYGTLFPLSTYIWLGASVITDVAIAAILLFCMQAWQFRSLGAETRLQKAACSIFSTFALSASLMLTYLILTIVTYLKGGFFQNPALSTAMTTIQLFTCPTYTISFIYTLNQRAAMKRLQRDREQQFNPGSAVLASTIVFRRRGSEEPVLSEWKTSEKGDMPWA